MENIRLVPAALEISFDRENTDSENFEREYIALNENDDDGISQWFRSKNPRGELGESDPAMINLMLELYRKLDRIEQLLTQKTEQREPLAYSGKIESIGFEHFRLNEAMLTPGERYYGRLELPVHPKHESSFYFEAVDGNIAKIIRMHTRDEREWGGYMRARERAMIRHLKGYE